MRNTSNPLSNFLSEFSGVTRWVMIGVAVMALGIGAAMPFYADFMSGEVTKMAALPVLLLLGILLIYDRKKMLVLILLARASGDVFFESTKFSLGGYQLGIGGLINAFVILIAILLVFEKPASLPFKSVKMWLPYFLVTTFGLVMAPVKPDAVRSWLSLWSNFAIFASTFYLVHDRKDFLHCIKLILWSSIFPVFYVFLDIAMHGVVQGQDGYRAQGTFGHPNILAFYLTIVISLGFYLLKSADADPHNRLKYVMVPYLFLLVAMLFLTKTRNAWLVALLSFGLYALIFQRRYFLYLLLIPLLGLLIPGVADRILDLGKGNEVATYATLNSFSWRVYLWQSAIDWTGLSQYPLGHGLQSFKEYSPIFFPLAGHVHWGAHSVVVQWFFEIGLLGLASYFWLYYRAARIVSAIGRVDRLAAFTLIVIIGGYVLSSFGDNMLDYLSFNWYLWFCVGAGCAYARTLPVREPGRARPWVAPVYAARGTSYAASERYNMQGDGHAG